MTAAVVWLANLTLWPVIQVGISYLALQLPSPALDQDTWITAPRRWERDGKIYRRYLSVRRWKSLLPDGASWLGGFAKKNLASRETAYLQRFLLETRRAELAHWCMFLCFPVFFLWNPPWAGCVMAIYAFGANLPCIVVQRYNRAVLNRLIYSRHPVPCGA